MRRILIGGTNSGCGKTTVTCGILQALCSRGQRVASFKCGPDYIDPMFHEKIIGTSAHNLDSFFCDDDTLNYLLHENGRNADISVIEGVMGFYDGYSGRGSAYSVSEITQTPVVLVVNCKGMSDSLGAMVKGFLEYKTPNRIVGFIFNRLPEKLTGLAKDICRELHTEYLGFLPNSKAVLESRHLGLVTADEVEHLKAKTQELGSLAERYILLDRILELSDRPFPAYLPPQLPEPSWGQKPVIAVARDRAFCFAYSDNLSLLRKLGCEIQFFSPMEDCRVPENACGLILWGGYPELYAQALAENQEMREDISRRIRAGMPAVAECGGFLYLHELLEGADGKRWPGVGIIQGTGYRTEKLQRFGYIQLTAQEDTLLCPKGGKLRAHEFHYWDSDSCGTSFTAEKADGRRWACIHARGNLFAGFPHLYFYSNIAMAEEFVKRCHACRSTQV